MFSMCSKLTPRARILDTRIPQLMQPCSGDDDDDDGNYQVGGVGCGALLGAHCLALLLIHGGTDLERLEFFSFKV